MRKVLLMALAVLFLAVGEVSAAGLTVRVEAPESPTNRRDFRLGFVALDVLNRPVTVDCYYKKPGGSFSKWETKSLAAGGDSAFCQVDSGEISERGTYDFYVVATAGGDTATSATVGVEYDDVGPGTPVMYARETQADGCSYKIVFRTADDSGETARVELYRSENPSFGVDGGSRIDSRGIGSDLEGEFYTNKPDCGKTYYYAIRAFDGHGNGSGVIGDTTPQALQVDGVGAIVVGESAGLSSSQGSLQPGGEVLGEGENGDEVTVSGEAASDKAGLPSSQDSLQSGGLGNLIKYGVGIVILVVLGYFLGKRQK